MVVRLRPILLSFALIFAAFNFASGCFITNCPPGGKRSIPDTTAAATKIRECASCGPEGHGGRCFGPETCCSPEFGCLLGTPETYICLLENRVNSLCHNPGSPCTGGHELGNFNGFCAADGICCSPESCELDETCRFDSYPKEAAQPNTPDQAPDPNNASLELEKNSEKLPNDVFTQYGEENLPEPKPPIYLAGRFKFTHQRTRLNRRRAGSQGQLYSEF